MDDSTNQTLQDEKKKLNEGVITGFVQLSFQYSGGEYYCVQMTRITFLELKVGRFAEMRNAQGGDDERIHPVPVPA